MEGLIISIMSSLTVFTRPYNGHEFPIFKRDTYHKTWRKNLVKIPPTFISYHVTNSITYCVVICFLSFMFVAQCVVTITCYYSLSEKVYNHIVMCHRCKVELLSTWLWINTIYVSRTSWPMPGKSHVLSVTKYFVLNVSHRIHVSQCLHLLWHLCNITELRGIVLIVYKLYFRSTILKMI